MVGVVWAVHYLAVKSKQRQMKTMMMMMMMRILMMIIDGIFFFRALPSKVGLAKLAEKIRQYNLHGLLVIGGYEVNLIITIIVDYFNRWIRFSGVFICASNVRRT